VVAALVLLVALPSAAGAASCTHDEASGTVDALVSGETASFSVGLLGQIQLDGIPCEGATVTTTDRISVTGVPGAGEVVVMDLSGGPFEPGMTPEAQGRSEIEVAVEAGGDPGDLLTIAGTGGPEVIRLGPEGGDLNADDDADVTAPGIGSMSVHAGAGDDVLLGGAQALGGRTPLPLDLRGDLGDDELVGGTGDDALAGGEGDDVVDGAGGDDALDGGDGTDRAAFDGAPGRIVLDLGLGTASGWGRDGLTGIEDVSGSSGPDRMLGDDTGNGLMGGPGNDRIGGGGGDDVVDGGPGKDFLRPGPGDDRAIGSAGSDTCSLRGAAGPVAINLRLGTATGQGRDLIVGIESAVGSGFRDVIRGTSAANRRLVGAGGNDRVLGLGGPDRLRGGSGEDDLRGGGGDDELSGTGDDDVLRGGPGDDLLSGGRGTDTCQQDQGTGRIPGCESTGPG
jgi:Ca2+-binding RTX toxin-like protein